MWRRYSGKISIRKAVQTKYSHGVLPAWEEIRPTPRGLDFGFILTITIIEFLGSPLFHPRSPAPYRPTHAV